ncbi:outer membrane beta-barrel family protein [Gaetbulibacter aestuarii]|uniref:Outer membrane beta-barrel family protein n=1 Tax=Gaetbulibacter aestuarii TaxID=1502358 RepID=A0ABW7N183_9FLAO
MFRIFISSLILVIPFSTLAQNLNLYGTAKDTEGNPVAFANVVLYNQDETQVIQGTVTNEEGAFKFENLEKGKYVLMIKFLGYEDSKRALDLVENTDLKPFVLTEKTEALDGVTVVYKKPTVTRLVDRLVFNVENSTLSNNSVFDVLKQTPGILYNNGTLTVRNSNPVIYINDRRVYLSASEVNQLLQGTPASNLKSVEVITNPPAKYDAEGGAVINIVTSKNIIAGYNGSIFGNYTQGFEYPKYSIGTSHFFKTKKLNTYVNYNINPRQDYRQNDEIINFKENNQTVSHWETDFQRRRKTANQNINTNIDYTIDDHNSIGITGNFLVAPRRNTQNKVHSETLMFDANRVLDSLFVTNNRLVEETFNMALTLDYVHHFKKEGETLSASLHHTNYDFSNFQDVNTDYLFPDSSLIRQNKFQTFSSQLTKIYTGQVDYELPIKNGAHFNAGAKYSQINSESILDQFEYNNGVRQKDNSNSDIFDYSESNYAAYSSYAKDWEAWSLKLGLRTEYTKTRGNSLLLDQVNNNDYLQWFPSFYLKNTINKNNTVYFNYNRRIFRPRYNQLNPFKYYLNDNTYLTGDPNLKPQIDDVLTLGYTLKQVFTFELYYRYENNSAINIVFQDNANNKIKYVNTNIDHSVSYGLDFMTYTPIVNHWNLYALSSLFYYDNKFFAIEDANALVANNKWSVYLQAVNYFTFLKDNSLTANLSLLYISPLADGASRIGDRSGINFSVRKDLWHGKASITMGVNDILNTMNFTQTTRYLNQDIYVASNMENRTFVLGFNYKFGNTGLQSNKHDIDLKERDRLKQDND